MPPLSSLTRPALIFKPQPFTLLTGQVRRRARARITLYLKSVASSGCLKGARERAWCGVRRVAFLPVVFPRGDPWCGRRTTHRAGTRPSWRIPRGDGARITHRPHHPLPLWSNRSGRIFHHRRLVRRGSAWLPVPSDAVSQRGRARQLLSSARPVDAEAWSMARTAVITSLTDFLIFHGWIWLNDTSVASSLKSHCITWSSFECLVNDHLFFAKENWQWMPFLISPTLLRYELC